MQPLTVDLLLRAYAHGHFPMDNNGVIEWYHPNPRGIIPLDERFHIPGRLARTIRSGRYRVTTDMAFVDVVRACAEPRPDHPTTWISERIVAAYAELHARGYAHSVETWEGETLVGGLYGVAVGGLFAGESMFSRGRDSSKVALVALVQHLRRNGFVVLDTQWVTDHLSQFGSYWLPDSLYQVVLQRAIRTQTGWDGFTG
jgi:leucyl/phenylalanyl-tRNA--protein transferase